MHRPNRGAASKKGSTSSRSSRSSEYTGFKRIEKYSRLTLPDGVHRRKLEKIKSSLIHRAKAVKSLRRVRTREKGEVEAGRRRFEELIGQGEAGREKGRWERVDVVGEGLEWNGIKDGQDAHVGGGEGEEEEEGREVDSHKISRQPQQAAQSASAPQEPEPAAREGGGDNYAERRRRKRERPSRSRFDKELNEAARVAAEQEQHKREREAREAERKRRELERARWRKAVNAKTRTGQVKLGKQSGLLLDKIKKQMEVA